MPECFALPCVCKAYLAPDQFSSLSHPAVPAIPTCDSYLYRHQNNLKESLLYALSCYLS